METLIFSLPGNEKLTAKLSTLLDARIGETVIRKFPDGETYLQIKSDVRDRGVVLVCSLNQPDPKLLPLYFLAKTANDMGAKSICLIAPYLAYMRQDKQFLPGEAVTSTYFGSLISSFVDSLVTVDPHLHRRSSLAEIYSGSTNVVHAANVISKWILNNVENPILVGPDGESEQWVSAVAKDADAPYIILEKIRHGDDDVEVSIPKVDAYKQYTPVLVDDIISTAHTMIETVQHLLEGGMSAPVCIGVHALFAGNAYENLQKSGAAKIVSCNTVVHESNQIDVAELLADGCRLLLNK